MHTTSNTYKSKIKEASRNFLSRITIGDKIITNDELVSLSIDGTLHSSDSFMIGGTASKSIDLTIIKSDDTVYTNQNIKVEIGLNLGDTVEYVLLGYFNIDQVEKTEHTIKFIAYDNMIKFEKPYFSNLGDTPTLQQVVNELAAKTGVQFEGSLPNYTVSKLNEYTCREVLSYVASLCGGNALITRDGKFTIVYPSEVSYSITGENYIDYKREDAKYKIGKLACQVGEEILEKGTLSADSRELQFENPWVTTTILNDLYTKLNGFEYLGYSMKWQGDIALDLGDIITCTDIKGVTRKLPIFSQKFNFTGGLTSEIGAKGETENKNSFSSSGSNTKNLQRVVTELAIVNKALVDVAYIDQLTAGDIKFNTASGGTLNLQSLLSNFISGESGQFLNLTGDNVMIADAVIKDAMIETVSANKINAGSINTNLVTIQGPSGNLLIKDNTIQIKDSTRVRVQIGKDASNDYSMYVWDSTGKLMFDATGLKEDGIKSKIIRDDMITDNANINGSKINISSLVTEMNKDTNTQLIKASKVAIDLTGQSLEVSFNSLKSNVDSKEGRNLAINTNFNSIWEMYNSARTNIDLTEYGQKITFKQASQSSMQTLLSAPLIEGEKYTISVELRGTLKTLELFILTTVSPNFKFYNSTTFLSETEFKKLVYTFTYTGNPSNKLFIGGTASTIGEWLEVKKGTVKLEKGTTNTGWIPAIEDTEEKIESNTTSINLINGRIETLVKDTTITNDGNTVKLQDFYSVFKQTSKDVSFKVESLETSTNQKVDGLSSRMATAELNLEPGQITQSISSAINNGTASISTVTTVLDKNGFTVKNGAIRILNKYSQEVLGADTSGNLTMTGNFVTKSGSNKAIEMVNRMINIYDWEGTTRTSPVGAVFSGRRIINGSTTALPGYVVSNEKSAYLSLSYKNNSGSYTDYILLDKDGIAGQGYSFPIWVQENMIVNSTLGIRNHSKGTYNKIWNADNNQLTIEINTNNVGEGLKIQSTTGSVLASIIAGRNYTIEQTSTQISGNFTVTGSKNSLQKTKNYADRLINAFETAEYYYSDLGFGKINEVGECYISIDDILQECISLDCKYHLFTQIYNGKISNIDRNRDYFIVYGEPNTEFSWQYVAKRLGYENVRLDTPEIGTVQDIAYFTDEDLENNTSEDLLLKELTFNIEDLLLEGVA